jgi:NCAIR mutase (PurE)-related protein
MDEQALKALLESFRTGELEIDQVVQRLRQLPFEDLGFAKVDHHRAIRCGFPEVIYCAGKTVDQVLAIIDSRLGGGGNVLATRASEEIREAVAERFPQAEVCPAARTVTIRQGEARLSKGTIAIVAAGTSDLPVAEEARVTAEIMDQVTETFYDVGVAGIHRLLAHSEALQSANVLIVVAGMEGALASVVGGLVDRPVIAVPTSVGYGASFQGLAALLAMLNSCASGVTVVNIDNGFAAGYTAALINRLAEGQ